ncbi:hypothetical protein CPAR01_15092 [Colletotrichum paranaense]|uniref:Secreted protein n=1 Tax=Colletotrichum paranaense TaxID=1914294 RepID=A0ABQ9RZG5_9PEZI|nr:uncharacterized protein CPAR01_15092 [Colletotrichum paranaense]KAK1520041.1 hypothetical protein CPAR01_15092 [Colletotrichum paranaense]
MTFVSVCPFCISLYLTLRKASFPSFGRLGGQSELRKHGTASPWSTEKRHHAQRPQGTKRDHCGKSARKPVAGGRAQDGSRRK